MQDVQAEAATASSASEREVPQAGRDEPFEPMDQPWPAGRSRARQNDGLAAGFARLTRRRHFALLKSNSIEDAGMPL